MLRKEEIAFWLTEKGKQDLMEKRKIGFVPFMVVDGDKFVQEVYDIIVEEIDKVAASNKIKIKKKTVRDKVPFQHKTVYLVNERAALVVTKHFRGEEFAKRIESLDVPEESFEILVEEEQNLRKLGRHGVEVALLKGDETPEEKMARKKENQRLFNQKKEELEKQYYNSLNDKEKVAYLQTYRIVGPETIRMVVSGHEDDKRPRVAKVNKYGVEVPDVSKKETAERRKNIWNDYQRITAAKKKEREKEYLASLPPEEVEAFKEKKRQYYRDYHAKVKAQKQEEFEKMTDDEKQEYLAEQKRIHKENYQKFLNSRTEEELAEYKAKRKVYSHNRYLKQLEEKAKNNSVVVAENETQKIEEKPQQNNVGVIEKETQKIDEENRKKSIQVLIDKDLQNNEKIYQECVLRMENKRHKTNNSSVKKVQ